MILYKFADSRNDSKYLLCISYKSFSIFVLVLRDKDILMKVFSLLSLLRNLENFIASRREQSIHHLVLVHSAFWHIAITGVGYCLFDARSSRTSKQINEKCSTLSFYTNHSLRSRTGFI